MSSQRPRLSWLLPKPTWRWLNRRLELPFEVTLTFFSDRKRGLESSKAILSCTGIWSLQPRNVQLYESRMYISAFGRYIYTRHKRLQSARVCHQFDNYQPAGNNEIHVNAAQSACDGLEHAEVGLVRFTFEVQSQAAASPPKLQGPALNLCNLVLIEVIICMFKFAR